MDVLGIVGSCRKGGNTDILVRNVLEGVERAGLATEILHLSDHVFSDCTGCEGCRQSFRCVVDDGMQSMYPLLEAARGLVIGSPTYFYNVTGITKNFLDRLYCYEFFSESDRAVWLGMNEVSGVKYAVTVAVCEQDNERDMGFTPEALGRSLTAVGYRVVDSVRAYRAFAKGDVARQAETLAMAGRAGEKLGETLKLHDHVKRLLAGSGRRGRTRRP
jgi:multimeric flavodoxin WrbA